MCFDPISLALMGGGMVANSAADGMDAKSASKFAIANTKADTQQFRQDAEEARVRNAVLDQYRQANDAFIGENQGTLGDTIAGFQPDAQTARFDATAADRSGKIGDAIMSAAPAQFAMRSGAPSVVQQTYDDRIGGAISDASASGDRLGKLGGIGDAFAANSRDIGGGQQKVNTVNQLSRGMMANLPAEQDLAGFQVRKPIFRPGAPDVNPWSSTLRGVGHLAAAAGGSGAMGGGANPAGAAGTMFGNTFVPTPWDPWAGMR